MPIKEMMNIFRSLFDSTVRTIVPAIVGYVLALLATTSLTVDPAFEGSLTGALTVLFNAVYYVAVRYLETRFSDSWGWFLGLAKSPEYKTPAKPVEAESDGENFFSVNGQG